VKRPEGKKAPKQHLCADKGYAGEPAQKAIESRNYIPHVRQRGEEAQSTLQGAPMGRRADPILAEQVSETSCPL